MRVSIVIPAFEAAQTIGATLASVFAGGAEAEVIVVDDGSPNASALARAVEAYPAKLLRHERNRGMCAARNTGIAASTGDIVTILDADDRFVANWPKLLDGLAAEWPTAAQVCFSACATPDGRPTVSHPGYSGLMTAVDFLNGRYAGEYLPLFRRPYIQSRGYVDLGTRRSCGTVTYLSLLADGPFHVSGQVLRIYDDRRAGSVSSAWTRPDKARESALCARAILDRFAPLYARHAPSALRGLHLRNAVYSRLAGMDGAWSAFRDGAHWGNAVETAGALGVLLFGPTAASAGVSAARALGLVRRHG
jgi:glycosyltransferase involved in cell wall biosynthesis